jgi:flagellar biosynthesis protein FlhF
VTAAPVPATEPAASGLEELRREIAALRNEIGERTPEARPVDVEEPTEVDPRFARWLEVLRKQGVGDESARRLVDSAAARARVEGAAGPGDALQRAIAEAFLSGPGLDEPLGERSTIVVGPTGAGKTAVLSKIAAERVARGERPVLVSADGESLAGEENLRAVGAALGLPVETAFLVGRIEDVVGRHGPGATYLIDTPGRSPFDREGVEFLRGLIRALPDAEILLVIPASTDVEEARLLVEGWAGLEPDRVVLTKLDELARPGRILDLARGIGRPVACVTFGRSVRGTSSAPGDPRVVSRILGTRLTIDTSA